MVLHETQGEQLLVTENKRGTLEKKFAPLFTLCKFILNSNLQHQ